MEKLAKEMTADVVKISKGLVNTILGVMLVQFFVVVTSVVVWWVESSTLHVDFANRIAGNTTAIEKLMKVYDPKTDYRLGIVEDDIREIKKSMRSAELSLAIIAKEVKHIDKER